MNTIVSILKKNDLITSLRKYASRILIEEKLFNLEGIILLFMAALFCVYLVTKTGIFVALGLIVLLIGIPFVVACLVDVRFGVLMVVFVSFSIFHLNRALGMYDLKSGVLIELFLVITSLGLLLRKRTRKESLKGFYNPVSFLVLLSFTYYILEAFNPNAVSITAWLFIFRVASGFLLMYIICFHAFRDLDFIKLFTKFWVFFAFLAGLYGIYQEVFGFTDFENRWVHSSEARFKLIFIWGHYRRMSFLSDAATFGVFMAYASIASLILGTGPYSNKKKAFYIIAGVAMIVSMTFSGTRTAYAVIPVGLGLFALMSATNKKTLFFCIGLAIVFLGILLGPFHSGTINRIRSTFSAEEDASFNVREENRKEIQPYIYENPIGGGLATTGANGERFSPGHKLAGFPPDSGMLRSALETGWIGLIIEYALYFVAMALGIVNYFKSNNPEIKNLYLVYLAPMFAFTVANYAQVTVGQRPANLLLYATFAIIVQLKRIDHSHSLNEKKHK